MSVIWLIIVGAAAGFLATRLMKWEANIVVTLAVGIAGALIGGMLLRTLLSAMGMMSGLVGAVRRIQYRLRKNKPVSNNHSCICFQRGE